MSAEKIWVKETWFQNISGEIGHKSVEDVLKLLQEQKELAALEGLKSLGFVYSGYGEDWWLDLVGYRLETDREFEKRKKKLERQEILQKKASSKKREKELKQYLKLKEKFEKKSGS